MAKMPLAGCYIMFISLFIAAIGISGYVIAQPNPGHSADRIGPGTFSGTASDVYTFPGILSVVGDIYSTEGALVRSSGWSGANPWDPGIYSNAAGQWMRFVTNNAPFSWFADSGTGTSAIMSLLSEGTLFIDDSDATGKGIQLESADRPMITRGWDTFTSGAYNGIGRWGLFMEPGVLTIGIPNIASRYIKFRSFNADSTGTDLVTITNTGNVGIGTSSPGYKLDVAGDAIVTDALSIRNAADGRVSYLRQNPNLELSSSNDDVIVWRGGFGFGRLTAGEILATASGSPAGVNAGRVTGSQFCIGASCISAWPSGLSGSGTANYVTKFNGVSSVTSSQIYDAGANVGIGTAAPSQKLEVAGNVQASWLRGSSGVCIGSDCRSAWPAVTTDTDCVMFSSAQQPPLSVYPTLSYAHGTSRGSSISCGCGGPITNNCPGDAGQPADRWYVGGICAQNGGCSCPIGAAVTQYNVNYDWAIRCK